MCDRTTLKIISHRGNIKGPQPDKENRPSYIDCAIGNGYQVEIDVNLRDGELWLGHDEPQYKINHKWIDERAIICGCTVKTLMQLESAGSIKHFVTLVIHLSTLLMAKSGCMVRMTTYIPLTI